MWRARPGLPLTHGPDSMLLPGQDPHPPGTRPEAALAPERGLHAVIVAVKGKDWTSSSSTQLADYHSTSPVSRNEHPAPPTTAVQAACHPRLHSTVLEELSPLSLLAQYLQLVHNLLG